MLSSCASWKDALQTFQLMSTHIQAPNSISQTCLIAACATAWRSALATTVSSSLSAHSAAAVAARRSGRWMVSLSLLTELKGRHIEGDTAAFNEEVNAQSASWSTALSRFHATGARDWGLPARDSVTVTVLLSALLKTLQWPIAMVLLEESAATGLAQDSVDDFAFLKAAVAAGEDHVVKKLISSAWSFFQAANTAAAGSLLLSRWPRWPLASAVLHELRGQGAEVDAVLAADLVRCSHSSSQWPGALELLKGMSSAELRLDVKSSNSIAASGGPEEGHAHREGGDEGCVWKENCSAYKPGKINMDSKTNQYVSKFLGPTYDDFREIVNKPMWLLRCIEHCRRSSARSERVTATVNNERLWAALDGHGLGESDLTEECWNTFGLFPPPLQETVLEAVRQSLLLKTEKNPSRFFTELCVNEEAVYNLEARRGDADEAVQVQPAQGTWESFSDSRYHELLRQLLLNTRNAEHQVLQVLSEEKPAEFPGLKPPGFDVNERTGHQLFSPLHLAASNGVLAATELLLAKGAQAWLLDDSGKTPLYHVVTTLPEAKASEQQLLLRIAQQLVLGMLQASEMDELLVESALEILQHLPNTQDWGHDIGQLAACAQGADGSGVTRTSRTGPGAYFCRHGSPFSRSSEGVVMKIHLLPKKASRQRSTAAAAAASSAAHPPPPPHPSHSHLTSHSHPISNNKALRDAEHAARLLRRPGEEQEQLRKKVNAMAKVLDLSRPLIAMLSALPFKAAEHAMNCFQIEERAPCVYAALLPDNDKEESDPGEEEVRTLNLSGDVKRTVGILHKWENERGFGFIHDENDTSDPPLDIFVHRTNLMDPTPAAAHLFFPEERKIAKLKEAIEREEHPLSKSFMQFLATAEMQEVIQENRQEGEAWLRCLGLLRQPPGGKRDDILWRKEIDRRVDIFLDLKTSPLTKKDIDYRCKRILTEFCMRSSAVRVSEALAMVEKIPGGVGEFPCSEAHQLLQSLRVLERHAQSLQELSKVACAAFHPMVRLGFFVPLALCATALLGRVYTLSAEICDAVSSARVLTQPQGLTPSTPSVITDCPLDGEAGTPVPSQPAEGLSSLRNDSDEDMGVPLEAEASSAPKHARVRSIACLLRPWLPWVSTKPLPQLWSVNRPGSQRSMCRRWVAMVSSGGFNRREVEPQPEKMAVDSKDVPLNSIGGAVPAESQPALELSALPPPAPAAAAPAPVLARAHEPAPEVVAIFPAPREDVEVKVEEREEHQIEEVSLEELTEEARRAKDNFVESFKAHLSRFSPEEEAQNEADLAKEHFLEAFCKKGAPQELRSPRVRRVRREQLKRRQVAEEVLQRQELQELLMSQHRHKVSHELRGEREIQEARMDQVNLEGGEDLQSKCAELEAENAECKVKLSQAATALWRSELLNTSAAEEEIALLREELAQLRSNESTAEASTAEAEQQMQTLAEEYQHALADIGSLRAIYDSEIEQLQLELQQCRETHEQDGHGGSPRWSAVWVFLEDVASLQDELQIARDQQESAKKAQSLQDVLSKRVVQLEAKLSQQTLEHEAMVEELEKLRPQAAATAAAEERASSAEETIGWGGWEVLATTARNFQAAEARQLQAEEMVRTLKLRCQSLEAQVQKRAENPNVPRSDHAIAIKATKPVARSDQPQFSALPGRRPLARVEGPLVAMASALSPTAPNTPLLETRKDATKLPALEMTHSEGEPMEASLEEMPVKLPAELPHRRHRPSSFPRLWNPSRRPQAQRLAGRPWRRLLRIASSIVKKQRMS
eukprot:g9846.t1